MTHIPQTLHISQVQLLDRGRTEYLGIEDLAESIADSGLIQPIVLVPNKSTPERIAESLGADLPESKTYSVSAGGRRFTALTLLFEQGQWDGVFHHGATSEPGRPGFVLRQESDDLLSNLIIEIKENLDRHDMDWRDELKLIVRAWRLAQSEAHAKGESILMRDFGVMLKCGYANLQIANKIYDHFINNPGQYEGVTSLRNALAVLLKCTANDVTRIAIAKNMQEPVLVDSRPVGVVLPSVTDELQPQRPANVLLPGEAPVIAEVLKENHIPLTRSFLNTNGIEYMAKHQAFCDHIICDPDYAIDVSVLDSHRNNRVGLMQQGVAQASVKESLRDLYLFINHAFFALREHGFCIFWYSLEYHERLIAEAARVGFAVQPWPLVWNKMDFRGRSNSAPNQNFPKSIETAMVLRKPGTVLRRVQASCVFTTSGNSVTKELNHPFAKPYDLWRWIYSAVTFPGQEVFDPFVGSGSGAIAAITYGLRPMGCEINTEIYHSLLINLQTHYRKLLGPNVTFS